MLLQELKEVKMSKNRRSRSGRKSEMTVEEKAAEAEALKAKGNQAFKEGDYVTSHELYSAALQLASGQQKAVRLPLCTEHTTARCSIPVESVYCCPPGPQDLN
jgi:hypothetical protein